MINKQKEIDLFKLIPRYLSFWPYFLFSCFIFLLGSFIYLRYATYYFDSSATIEVLDKSQDSEMALPTAVTVFNRSMINLDNEIGRLSSYNLNSQVVKVLNANIKFYTVGTIKTTEDHISEFFTDYSFDLNISSDSIVEYKKYIIQINKGKMKIDYFDQNHDLISSLKFPNPNTNLIKNDLPFRLNVRDSSAISNTEPINKEIIFYPFQNTVQEFIQILSIAQTQRIAGNTYSRGSDQINLSIRHPNKKISVDYLNKLISYFDQDGIQERQLEYKNTIDFVNERSVILQKELELVENNLLEFKRSNGLTDIKLNTNVTIEQQYTYDSDLFEAESQKSLLDFLKAELELKDFKLLPINFGLKDLSLNELIGLFNLKAQERLRLLNTGAGIKNPLVLNLNAQLKNYYSNIEESIDNYYRTLELSINEIEEKEKEISDFYVDIPKNEKILRSIKRELEIKEALYLLLLQKKEEASINFAVVKPTIKIIDFARSSMKSVYPRKLYVYFFSAIAGILIPIIFISIVIFLDNKIHIRDDLSELDIPVIAELPHIPKLSNQELFINTAGVMSRNPLVESIRMLIANLKYSLNSDSPEANVILISSSIKGEGKTIVSTYLSNTLALSDKRVLLIGADLKILKFINFMDLTNLKLRGFLTTFTTLN